MLPISTDTPIRRTPYVNYALVGLNVAIFLVTGGAEHAAIRPNSLLSRLTEWGVLDSGDPQLYQFFTYQFLHAGWAHVGGNMLFLWTFGNPLNSKMGNGPYLFFYLAGGVFAATGYGFYNDTQMIGASGAIAAVTTAYLALFPRSHITILYWFILIGTFELPSMIMIVFKMILWDNILAARMAGESNVAFGAHLAGYAFGFFAASGMLALRFLPRDQFDIVALWRRWYHRRYTQSVLTDPNAQAQAQFGRVARPVMLDAKGVRPVEDSAADQVTDVRMRIAEALSRNERDAAAGLYEKLLELDSRQVLGRQQQLEIANQLCTLDRIPQAVAAYEKFLTNYPTSPEADAVKLLLGIMYARDLQQYEVAEGHLRQSLERLTDERRRDQARHWLAVAAKALGHTAPGA